MRLVDADVFAEKMKGVYEEYMWEVLDETPTIDAVPVVRCKDCRWRTDLEHTAWHPCDVMAVNDNWYCADGERM